MSCCRQTNAFVDLAKIRTAHAAFSPDFLAVRALKRRQRFASKAAVFQSFASKPPFQDFQSSALSAYIEHGFRELSGRPALPVDSNLTIITTSIDRDQEA